MTMRALWIGLVAGVAWLAACLAWYLRARRAIRDWAKYEDEHHVQDGQGPGGSCGLRWMR